MWEVGVIIKERGRRKAGGVRLCEEDSAGIRGWSTLRAGEFLSCGTNMRAGISEVLGDELTTLGEADGAIEKREEHRRDKWASGWIWVYF